MSNILESFFKLGEDLECPECDSNENTLNSPLSSEDNYMAERLGKAIQDEYTAIKLYNEIALSAREMGFEDIAKLLDHIGTEENNHVGMLQEALKKFSENANAIEDGKEEAKDDLHKFLDKNDLELVQPKEELPVEEVV